MNTSKANTNLETDDSDEESVKLVRVSTGVPPNNSRKKHSIQVVTPPTATKNKRLSLRE